MGMLQALMGILGWLVALSGTASAQSQSTLVIGFSPGAIYDAYGRLVAKHLGRHLPGQPTIVVQNMPGAGTLRLANYLYTVAPKDGSTIGLFARGIPMQPLLDPQGIQFDALKFNWLGSASPEVSVVMAGASTSSRRSKMRADAKWCCRPRAPAPILQSFPLSSMA
jgi:tripartite-type tricarboxylate transporter receptor subunit TctC